MSRPIIEVRNVSKAYQLGAIGATSLKEEVSRLWDRARGRRNGHERTGDTFWALRDVSFDVHPGEVVGIIGRNGAGKSTLLKILSRITQQTSGEITLRGRVASLLEVGTGFHPDLTGRENIFLNGAILGMTKAEIRKKFDEIVAFAEVDQFIDTPVKRYSSGMYVRLAFAVAAHLEPEILIVDEVLAVGDAAFQQKCIGKMGDVAADQHRTVLFVSHNLGAVSALCHQALWMSDGEIASSGDTLTVAAAYLRHLRSAIRLDVTFETDGTRFASLLRVRLSSARDVIPNQFQVTDQLFAHVTYHLPRPARGMNLALTIRRNGAPLLLSFDTDLEPNLHECRAAGTYEARVALPMTLKAGQYSLTFGIGFSGIGVVDERRDAIVFEIDEVGVDYSHRSFSATRTGELMWPVRWDVERV